MQLIKALESARGNGTSMISLILPPKDQVGPNSYCICLAWSHMQQHAWAVQKPDYVKVYLVTALMQQPPMQL